MHLQLLATIQKTIDKCAMDCVDWIQIKQGHVTYLSRKAKIRDNLLHFLKQILKEIEMKNLVPCIEYKYDS